MDNNEKSEELKMLKSPKPIAIDEIYQEVFGETPDYDSKKNFLKNE